MQEDKIMEISGKRVSALSLGTAVYREANLERAFELMDTYRACGGNVFDTARVYGESGRASCRERV